MPETRIRVEWEVRGIEGNAVRGEQLDAFRQEAVDASDAGPPGNAVMDEDEPRVEVGGLAEKFGGTYTQFLSPAVFSESSVLDFFMKEKAVNYILDEFRHLNVVLVGIGVPDGNEHTLAKAGYMTSDEREMLVDRGAVGDMCLQFYDRDGNTDQFSFYNDRVAAMRLKDIRRIPSKIGIAGSARKAEAVIGAIRGGYLNILITDTECARKLIELAKLQ